MSPKIFVQIQEGTKGLPVFTWDSVIIKPLLDDVRFTLIPRIKVRPSFPVMIVSRLRYTFHLNHYNKFVMIALTWLKTKQKASPRSR